VDQEKDKEVILRDVLKKLSDIDFSISPPEMARQIFDTIEKFLPKKDFYFDIKQKSNHYILNLEDELRSKIQNAPDPFEVGMRLAIAGNIIDFGAKNNFSDDLIHTEIQKAVEVTLDKNKIETLKSKIENADKILYLGDNAGEIVFDKLFLELLPREKITFAVRGSAIINDALMLDAETVGLTQLLPVISNGDNVRGTVVSRCSELFK